MSSASQDEARFADSVDSADKKIPGAFPDQDPAASSTQQTLSQALFSRRAEYTRPQQLRIRVGTWNVAALKDTEKDIGRWFIDGKGASKKDVESSARASGNASSNDNATEGEPSKKEAMPEGTNGQASAQTASSNGAPDEGTAPENIGLYVLGLQEVVDVASPAEALRPYTDPTVATRWKSAIEEALPDGYQLVADQQLIGLLLLIYASPSVLPEISSVSTTSVGTGLMGYMGNKGAVASRLVLSEVTKLVFINSHLAAGSDKAALERRNWDAGQIVSRTKFSPISDPLGLWPASGDVVGDEDFAFWFGDLNYRLQGMPGDDVRRLLMLHTRNEYDLNQPVLVSEDDAGGSPKIKAVRSSNSSDGSPERWSDLSTLRNGSDKSPLTSPPSELEDDMPATEMDPASLQATLSSLLPHDELLEQQKARKAFHDGWKEGQISFLPTYKYDVGSVGIFDSSEKKRCPSWCDRILYRTRRDKTNHDRKAEQEEESRKRHRDEVANELGQVADEDDLLFDYNPEADGNEYDEEGDRKSEAATTKEGVENDVRLEHYMAHQKITSSDHKPLEAIFSLDYSGVVKNLKARVHQEVVRQLDKAENEARPTITVLVDKPALEEQSEPTTNNGDVEGVDFGDVRFSHTIQRSITIASTGRVAARVAFIERPTSANQDPGSIPRWLRVHFDKEIDKAATAQLGRDAYLLEPGDSCNVDLAVRITDIDILQRLNEGVEQLEDILVLRVENGRDHFLPVRGRWLQSSFGQTIDKLIRVPDGGIRKLQEEATTSKVGADSENPNQAVKWSAPRELFRLTESIEELGERALAEWEMTVQGDEVPPWEKNAAWPFAEESWTLTDSARRESLNLELYEALDTDQAFDGVFPAELSSTHRLEVLGETLLFFLRSLKGGVINESLWVTLETRITANEKHKHALSQEEERMQILEVLASSPNRNITFVLLTSMLAHMSKTIAEARKEPLGNKTNSSQRGSMDLPASPKAPMRRRTLSQVPAVARRQIANKNMAAMFAEVMVRLPQGLKARERARAEERRIRVIEVFLGE